LLKAPPGVDVICKATCKFTGHGSARNLYLKQVVVQEGYGNWGALIAQGKTPSSVGVRIRYVVGPFFIHPFCYI